MPGQTREHELPAFAHVLEHLVADVLRRGDAAFDHPHPGAALDLVDVELDQGVGALQGIAE